VAEEIRSGRASAHCCRTIVTSQAGTTFLFPEPWVGEIEHAPILFISSNPSIDEQEEFPNDIEKKWTPELTTDFFQNRFGLTADWVKDGKVLRRDGSRGKSVRFWASARSRVSELMQEKDKIEPGIDFAITEVVHCKSRRETGVREAQEFCSGRYLKKILDVSVARVLIVYGRVARDVICRYLGQPKEKMLLDAVDIAGIPRMFVFLPHPNSRGTKKTLEANLGKDLPRVRAHLKGTQEK
jgi:hypothetical protein